MLSSLMQCFNTNLIQASLLFSTGNDVRPSGILQEKYPHFLRDGVQRVIYKYLEDLTHDTVLNSPGFDHHIVNVAERNLSSITVPIILDLKKKIGQYCPAQ